ncbi:MAG: tetratricopeptide repeat protein [Oligoflexia bacterium]|nr:tetratricopeptide repeat protein [Oligoflexia bacterium]
MKLLNQFFDKLTQNYRAFLSAVIAIVAITAMVAFVMSRKTAKNEEANQALFMAHKAIEKELTAMAEARAPKAPEAKAKTDKDVADAKTPPVSPETLRFEKLDVDAQLTAGVNQLKAVTEKFEGTRGAFEANLALGNLYFEHGEPAKAVAWLNQAAKSGKTTFDQATAWLALGHAYEDSGKLKEALESYEKALATGEAVAKGEALLSVARSHELLKDTAKARSTYDQVISQLPSSEYAKTAEARKAALE